MLSFQRPPTLASRIWSRGKGSLVEALGLANQVEKLIATMT